MLVVLRDKLGQHALLWWLQGSDFFPWRSKVHLMQRNSIIFRFQDGGEGLEWLNHSVPFELRNPIEIRNLRKICFSFLCLQEGSCDVQVQMWKGFGERRYICAWLPKQGNGSCLCKLPITQIADLRSWVEKFVEGWENCYAWEPARLKESSNRLATKFELILALGRG